MKTLKIIVILLFISSSCFNKSTKLEFIPIERGKGKSILSFGDKGYIYIEF